MACDTPARIAILGAGPVGLEAALYARFLGYEVIVLERGRLAENVAALGQRSLETPFRDLHSTLGLAALEAQNERYVPPPAEALLTASEWIDGYLAPLAETDLLAAEIHTQTRVTAVMRLDAPIEGESTGEGGIPPAKDFDGADDFEGESADAAPSRFLVQAEQANGARLDYEASIVIDTAGMHVQGLATDLRLDLDSSTSGVRRIVASTPPAHGAAACAEVRWTAEDLVQPTPHFYLLGLTTFGERGGFTFAAGLRQIRLLFSLVGGRATLDLYAGALSLLKKV